MIASALLSRRGFLAAGTMASLRAADSLPPVRAITKGPKHHWFGYYDKLQFDPTNRYVLGMEVGFEHRSPTPEDTIRVGMVDLQDGDRWIDLGESRAWCWQQGCMLQWIPGSKSEVIWNDRQEGRFVSHILNVKTGKKRTLPSPIYALSPNGKWAVAPDFRRLHHTRPGYGYAGVPDPNRELAAPKDAGIWKMDLGTGRTELLFSIAAAAAIPYTHGDWTGAKHWFNHLLVAPDGKRFCFLHRWQSPSMRTRLTRMFTMDPDGKNLYNLIPYGGCSHFIWRDPAHMFAWSFHPSHKDRFYLWKDRTDEVEVIGKDVMKADGHGTYLPGNQWILNDTYPDANRNQNPFLYHVATGKLVPLGHFLSPKEYTGEWRCDTHPRFSPNGRLVTIDSPHAGTGRQIHLIDISGVVGHG
ncbi:MAG: hypothetical protein U0R19_32410 [Bryobacteraceae bacterium]